MIISQGRQSSPLCAHPGDKETMGDYGRLRVRCPPPPTLSPPCLSVPGQELKELAAQVKDVSVTVGMDSRCHIDLSGIVEEVKAQYDAIAARSLEEAEAYSRSKVWGCQHWVDGGSQDRRGCTR